MDYYCKVMDQQETKRFVKSVQAVAQIPLLYLIYFKLLSFIIILLIREQ